MYFYKKHANIQISTFQKISNATKLANEAPDYIKRWEKIYHIDTIILKLKQKIKAQQDEFV